MRTVDAITRPWRAEDVPALASSMRPEDRAEIQATGVFADPVSALTFSLGVSRVAFAVELGGELACLGGVQDTEPVRTVWLLTSTAVDRHRRAFWRESQRVMSQLLRNFSPLTNRIDSRYQASLRWAKRLGATIGPASVLAPERVPFHQVVWR